jgi:branched-chain amino acid transport system substrate-binding protein
MRFTKTPTASKRFRATLAAAAAVTLASTLAACGAADEGGGDDEIVIGISLPLTGDFSEPGKGIQRGYEAWAEYVNANGGLLGRDVRL